MGENKSVKMSSVPVKQITSPCRNPTAFHSYSAFCKIGEKTYGSLMGCGLTLNADPNSVRDKTLVLGHNIKTGLTCF